MRNLILASLLGALSIVGCDTAEAPTTPSSNVREARAEAPAPSVGGSGSGLTTQGVGIRQISQIAPLTSNFWTERRDNSSDRPCKNDYGRFNIFASWSSAGADEYEYKVKVWNTETGTIGPNIRRADVEKTGHETIDGGWTAHRKKTGSPREGDLMAVFAWLTTLGILPRLWPGRTRATVVKTVLNTVLKTVVNTPPSVTPL